MPRFRTSFRGRLIIGAIIWIFAGLGVSWIVLAELFRTHAESEFVDELDHHTTELVNLTGTDAEGRLRLQVPLSDFRFMAPLSGYYWQIERPTGETLRSPSLGSARLALSLDFSALPTERHVRLAGPTGELLLLERVVALGAQKEPVRFAVGTDQRLVEEFLATFKRTLALSLGTIALGLIVAAFAQIAIGLRPLGRIRVALLAVRRGETRRLPTDLPAEVAPLAANVNALLDTNEEMIRRARVQAGNLAHALKSPLAVMMDEGMRLEAAGNGGRAVIEQCQRMRRQIDYQLARTRAAVSRISGASATRIGPTIDAIMNAVGRLYHDRGLRFDQDPLNRDIVVACEVEDLEEILGNLIDNAAQWSRSRVKVAVTAPRGGVVRVAVEDDGPGMPPEARERVFGVGERLDESIPGTGLGLAIVRDVVTLYGGRTWIDKSMLGGAAVYVELPAEGQVTV